MTVNTVLNESTNPISDAQEDIELSELLSIGRVCIQLHVSSQKRMLEEIASLLIRDDPTLDKDEVFRALIERERLGSTAIGNGVTLPHGRLAALDAPVMAFATLKQPLTVDTPDDQPVNMVVGILVPEHGSDMHVRLLSKIAAVFAEPEHCSLIEAANSPDEAVRLITELK